MPDTVTGLSDRDKEKIVANLKTRVTELRGKWREKIRTQYPLHRSELTYTNLLDPETLGLADKIFSALEKNRFPKGSRHERMAAAALLYLLEDLDVIQDSGESSVSHFDDRFAIQWTYRQVMEAGTDAESHARLREEKAAR